MGRGGGMRLDMGRGECICSATAPPPPPWPHHFGGPFKLLFVLDFIAVVIFLLLGMGGWVVMGDGVREGGGGRQGGKQGHGHPYYGPTLPCRISVKPGPIHLPFEPCMSLGLGMVL